MEPFTPNLKAMQEIAAYRDGKCLSKEFWDVHTPLEWQCEKGHTWDATPFVIKNGHWCPACIGRKKRLTIEDMQVLAKAKGGKCLSEEYINGITKLAWECKEGHTWNATPTGIKQGNWCAACAGLKKLTIEEMHSIAQAKGGKCLSEKYINNKTKLKWQCEQGHVWYGRPDTMQSQNSWCAVCSGNQKLTIEAMHVIAKAKGGTCLSKKYINNRTKLNWQCKEGHIWSATPDTIKYANSWCPVCAVKTRTDKRRGNIEEMHALAKSKGGKCLSKKYIDSATKLKWQCGKGHRWETAPVNIKNSNSWCPVCAGKKKSTMEEMHALAKAKGGKCLSKKYINSTTKLKWQCKEGHIWDTKPATIKNDNCWCPACAGKQKLTIEDLYSVAKGKGGKCLSKKYINNSTKLQWQCKQGHIWNALPNNIKNNNSWCPVCAGTKKSTIEEMHALAKARGGKCMSKTYINSFTKLKWQCKEGHIWDTKPATIKNDNCWCPVCARKKAR